MLKLTTYVLAFLVLAQVQAKLNCPPKSPPPAGEVCGVRGNVAHPKRALSPNKCAHSHFESSATSGSAIVDSLQTCQDYCLDMAFNFTGIESPQRQRLPYRFCYTFAYDTNSNRCFLYYQVPRVRDNPFGANDTHHNDVLGFKPDESSSIVFYTINCFNSCSPICPSAPGSNLFDNPSWDEYVTTVFPWAPSCFLNRNQTTPVKIVPREDKSGNFLRIGEGAKNFGFVQQTRTPCPLKKYLVKVSWRAIPNTTPVTDVGFTLDDITTKNVYLDCGVGDAPTNWSIAAVSFDAVAEDFSNPFQTDIEGRVVFEIAGQNIDIDNAALVPISDTVDTEGANVLGNPGFETGKLPPWLGFNRNVQVHKPGLTEGQYSMYLHGVNGFEETTIQQRLIPVTPFVPHVWRFDYRITAVRDKGDSFFFIDITSEDNNVVLFEVSPGSPNIKFNKTTSYEYVFTPVTKTIDIELIITDFDMILDNSYIKKAVV